MTATTLLAITKQSLDFSPVSFFCFFECFLTLRNTMRVFSDWYSKGRATPSSNGRAHLSSGAKLAHKSCGSCLLWLVGFSLAVITVFQCALAWKILSRLSPSESLGEVNELFPSVGVKVVRFVEKEDFNALNMSDPEWERAMPRGGGFVKASDLSKKGATLPRPILIRGQSVYNVAVFHQLHCLHALGEEFNNLISAARDDHSTVVTDDQLEHISHCLAYLKQSLECCSDTAFEGQSSITDLPSTSGFGSYHVCRDFDRVVALSEQQRATEMSGYGQGKGHNH
ncbi:Putative mycotoxin biosynthesis protein UstYa [Colletotrichum destructivum]|uniref:Mycotoxin biosynthesis protein UstYa n=1 Tax=Colletotrichum destructivum TaxID=34406 RepID=A0AAX4IM04_9PEZI|nr:Putative mycotoxin biosynthesis protein UstYa [Colletotrichum destructivum]